MDDSFSGNLRIWDAAAPAEFQDPPVFDLGHSLAGPHNLSRFAGSLYAREALGPSTGVPGNGEVAEPYSLQWFLNAEYQRHRKHGRWIPRLLEFGKHSGEMLLGLGDGLGTDWVQYAQHGARVCVCSSSRDQVTLIRRNFELRGLSARFVHASAASLPLESATIDVACVSDLSPELDDLAPVVTEIYRVLKPGGKVLAVLPARYDIDFWLRCALPWQRWLAPRREDEVQQPRFTRRNLKRLFGRFVDARVYKRQLRRSEIPHLWRWLPRSLFEKCLGHLLLYKAFKPLSAAKAIQEAA